MPSTTDQLQQIARTLNTVKSAGQVRVAIGQTLKALSRTYPLLNRSGVPPTYRKDLDSARVALEEWFRRITAADNQDYSVEWAKNRRLVDRAYVAIAGVEGAAEHEPEISNWQILATSIAEAPGVFLGTVGKAAGAVAKEAGNVAGAAVGGILSGLGPVMSIVVVGGVIWYLRKGGVLGAVLGKVGL